MKRVFFWAVGLILIVPFLVWIVLGVNYILDLDQTSEPNEFKSLFKESNGFEIEHVITIKYKDKTPLSSYKLNGFDYGVSILKLPTMDNEIISRIRLFDKKISSDVMKSKSSLYGCYDIEFSEIKNISHLDIFIENFRPTDLIEKNDSLLYLAFDLDESFAIDYSSEQEIDIYHSSKSSLEIEKNEL